MLDPPCFIGNRYLLVLVLIDLKKKEKKEEKERVVSS